MSRSYGPPDLRSHKSLADVRILDFITNIRAEDVGHLVAYAQEAEEFEDDTLRESVQRLLRYRTAIAGKRAELMADVAIHDEALRVASESRMPPKQEGSQGP